MFAAILRFEVKPEHRQVFVDALVKHGRAALPNEPETLRFDIIEDRTDPNCILLYEAYANMDAFDHHRNGASHGQLVRALSEHQWLRTPLAVAPEPPFGPFLVGAGFTLFSSAAPDG